MHIEGVKIKQVHKVKFEGVDDKCALNHITSSSFIPESKSILSYSKENTLYKSSHPVLFTNITLFNLLH